MKPARAALVLGLVAISVVMIAGAAGPVSAQEDGEWYNSTGQHSVDVSDTDWVWIEAHGADGEFGSTDDTSCLPGTGGDGAYIDGAGDVSGVNTVDVFVPQEGDTFGATNGSSGETVFGDGDGGDGAGSAGVVWDGAVRIEAGGGGGGGGVSESSSPDDSAGGSGGDGGGSGGDGGNAGGYYDDGSTSFCFNDGIDGADGAGSFDDAAVESISTTSGGASTDGAIYIESASADELFATPQVTNPNPGSGARVDSRSVTLSVDVTDDDFDSDTVTVQFFNASDDSLIGEDTLGSAGTASTSWDADPEENQWYAVAEDSYGLNRSTAVQTFRTPSTLEIRDELNNSLVDDREVTVEFYPRVAGDDRVTEVSTSDGTIDLERFDVDTEYVLALSAAGYRQRQTVIRDITREQYGYILENSSDNVQIRFMLEDNTGRYEGDAVLEIQRPINESGTRTWRTVAGDEFGVAGVTEWLQVDQRYRLVLRNDQGDRRVLGRYTPTAAESVPLQVGSVSADPGEADDVFAWSASYQNTTAGPQVRFEYLDEQNATDRIHLRIHARHDESNELLANTTYQGPIGELVVVEGVPESENETSWVVKATIERNGESITAREIVSPGKRDVAPGVPQWLQLTIAYGFILMTAGMFSRYNAPLGAVVTAAEGGIFWYLGFLDGAVGLGVVLLAMILSGIMYIRASGSGGGL